ncbi:MAG TPA: hypothetical protein VHU91_04140 [Mycobacteriales bacterium]|jgi:hypothetical protein|nr:hypothetical protein [Mycobacteriales bacterium]
MLGSHSHNDSQQHVPLWTALRHGFVSVEADMWSANGRLLVGHDRGDLRPDRTLRTAYLEPLATLIAEIGAVHPGYGEPFRLLIDVKNDPDATYSLLEDALAEYAEIVTRYDGARVTIGPVSVVMTGDYPWQTIAGQRHRLVACDGRLSDIKAYTSATLMPTVSEPWHNHFRWRGFSSISTGEREKLRRMVAETAASGRTLRFWGAPLWPAHARRAAWNELAAAGVGYIGADHLSDFRRWWEQRD